MLCNVCVFIRYNVDPDEVEESKEYARSWMRLSENTAVCKAATAGFNETGCYERTFFVPMFE